MSWPGDAYERAGRLLEVSRPKVLDPLGGDTGGVGKLESKYVAAGVAWREDRSNRVVTL